MTYTVSSGTLNLTQLNSIGRDLGPAQQLAKYLEYCSFAISKWPFFFTLAVSTLQLFVLVICWRIFNESEVEKVFLLSGGDSKIHMFREVCELVFCQEISHKKA